MADKVPVNLPIATSEPPEKVEDTSPKITLSIVRKSGATNYYWGEQLVTPETLAARMRAEAQNSNNRIRMKIRADKTCRYEDISAVLKLAKNSGIQFVSFVSSPEKGG